MGTYCCCGSKIRQDDWKCFCDWEGWTSFFDFPDERNNKDTPLGEPKESGEYLARYINSSGDRYETDAYFSLEPLRKDIHQIGWLPCEEVDVHWEPWDSETLGPYAWKKKPGK